jgi:sodium-dependent dicarboxylate transporter 2/3/5
MSVAGCGGIALGIGLEKADWTLHVIQMIPFAHFSPAVVAVLASLSAVLVSTFISNTARPISFADYIGAGRLPAASGHFRQSGTLIVIVAISCSLAMALPVSTPPNAIAMASGDVATKDMIKAGSLVGVIGLGAAYVMFYVLIQFGSYMNTLTETAEFNQLSRIFSPIRAAGADWLKTRSSSAWVDSTTPFTW